MDIKYYRNIKTDEIVYEEDAESYVLNRLGITVTPRGENGEMTLEQLENMEETVSWFFSGNWIEEDVEAEENDDIPNLEYELCRYENYHEAMFEGKVY